MDYAGQTDNRLRTFRSRGKDKPNSTPTLAFTIPLPERGATNYVAGWKFENRGNFVRSGLVFLFAMPGTRSEMRSSWKFGHVLRRITCAARGIKRASSQGTLLRWRFGNKKEKVTIDVRYAILRATWAEFLGETEEKEEQAKNCMQFNVPEISTGLIGYLDNFLLKQSYE